MPDNFIFKSATALVILLLAFAGYRVFHPITTFEADGIDPAWDAAAQQSHDAGKPTVVLFTANWCGTCRALHAEVLSRDDVRQELAGHYSFYTVDLSYPSREGSQHSHKLGVNGIPMMIRYNADGKETARANYLEPSEMIAWLQAGE